MKEEKKINKGSETLTVLIAPLDWGLGHATRCIPIIKEFKGHGCKVLLAGNETLLSLFKKEFPEIEILPLFGYNIKYSKHSSRLFLNLFFQLPKLWNTIIREHRWLKKIVRMYQPDIVVSDNRLGMYHANIVSIYMTHQLTIKTGYGFMDIVASFIHNRFIKKYDECWVPDFEVNGLAGELSHPANIPPNVVYIGAISRFNKLHLSGKIYKILICLSGPEPQRTILETILLGQLENFNGKVLMVRGILNECEFISLNKEDVEIVNHLPAAELNAAFQQAEIIICRSGYTTIMDLVKIEKQAILIPTPGQPEQEYLAYHLLGKKNFFSIDQQHFNLYTTLQEAEKFSPVNGDRDMDLYKITIAKFLNSVRSGKYGKKFALRE
ncbi:MAG: glycosyltransferase [Ginsengibacter sp.]